MADDEEMLDDDIEEESEYNIPAIIIAVVLILALIGTGVWYFLIREPPAQEEEVVERPVWEPPEDLQPEEISDILGEMVIDPRDGGGRYHLVVEINISLNDKRAAATEITAGTAPTPRPTTSRS